MDDIIVRQYTEGDEYEITDLLTISGTHLRTAVYWRWSNIKTPFSRSICVVLEAHDKTIIGHYSIMNVKLFFNGDVYNAGFGGQLVIHPQFRNFKLLWKLLNFAWEKCKENKIDFVFAFPNANIWPIKYNMMNWKLVNEFKSLELNISDSFGNGKDDVLSSQLEFERITNLGDFENTIDRLWNENKIDMKSKIYIEKNFRFVSWRFFRHPLHHYPFFLVKNNGKYVGWVALKLYNKNSTSYGHIVDVVALGKDHYIWIVKEAVSFFKKYNVNILSLWCGENLKKLFKELGFKETGFSTNFGIKIINNVPETAMDINAWDLTMSYSDAF